MFSKQPAEGMLSIQNAFRNDEDRLFHGDLKSDNVLVRGDPNDPLERATIKIADFGESHAMTEEGKRKGTIPYMAPEVWTKNFEKMKKYNWMNADVWSFGVICWELLTVCATGSHQSPVDAYKELQMDTPLSLERGLLNGKRLPRPNFGHSDPQQRILFDTLVTSCWQFECGSRPDWRNILQNLNRIQSMSIGIPSAEPSTHSPSMQHQSPQHVQLREVQWTEIVCGDFIDEGAFGAVYKGTWQGIDVAVKKLLMKTAGKRIIKEMISEAQLLCQVEHINVVRLHGVCLEAPNFALILEFAAPSLYLLLCDIETISLGDQALAALEISRGMDAIHRANIFHHDLRCANVLIGPKGDRRCRITDFGLSRTKMQSSRFSTKTTGNPAWSAPEYLAGNALFNGACDVFSFAMVLYEICSDPPGLPPFEDQAGDNVRSLYMEGKRPVIHDGVDTALAALIQQCWDQDPSRRPTFARLVQLIEGSGKVGAGYTV